MATLEKLSIQGIRSFGPDDKDKQIMEIFTPLTLILGPNGTGKTTIIECLRYMATGELPPGAGGTKGSAFIHDPKVAHEREINAQIRLQFHDVQGKPCCIQRSMSATQKAKKVDFKTRECVITRRLADGSKSSIGSKCLELNREMVSLLGVSKPVLENVIFCHQEESNWPLGEGKALKQKFDDMFASTRYVKALDSIRKVRQDQTGLIKNLATSIVYLKQNKEKASEIRGDLEQTETKYMAAKESAESVTVKLQPIEKRLREINENASDIMKIQTKIESLKSEKVQMERAEQELRDSIENEFQGNVDELKTILEDFQVRVGSRQKQLRQTETTLEEKEHNLEMLNRQNTKLLLEQGKLEQEAENHEHNIRKRDAQIQKIAEEHDFEGFSDIIGEKHVQRFLNMLETKANDVLTKAKETRAQFEDDEEKMQKEIDKLRSTKTQLETQLRMNSSKVEENKREVKNINQKLSLVNASAERLQDIKRDLAQTTLDLSDAEKSINLEELQSEIQQLQQEKSGMDQQMKKLDTEMNRISLESTVRNELEFLRKEKTTKEDQIRRLKSKHEDSLRYLLKTMPKERFKYALDQYLKEETKELRNERSLLQTMKIEVRGHETNKNNNEQILSKKEEEMRNYEEKIFKVSDSQNFDKGFENIQSRLKTAQDQKGLVEGTKHMFNKYIDQLKKSDDPCCPLCRRGFDARDEVTELVDNLEERLSQVPEKLETVTQKIDSFKKKYEEMLQLKPIRSVVNELQTSEIPTMKAKIKKLNEQIEILRENITDKEDRLETVEIDEGTAKSMLPDAAMIDNYVSELRILDQKIVTQQAKLSGGDSSRTMKDVTNDREDFQDKLESVNRSLDRKRDKHSNECSLRQNLKSRAQELKGEELQIQSDLQQRMHLEEQKKSLHAEIEDLRDVMEVTNQELQPLQSQIQDQERDKTELTKKKQNIFEKDKEQYSKVQNSKKDVKVLQQGIDQYLRDKRPQYIKEKKEEMRNLQTKVNEVLEEIDGLNANVKKLQEELSKQQMRERELEDNLKLRLKQDEIRQTSLQIDKYTEKLGGLDVSNLERERRKAVKEQESLIAEKHQADGRLRGYEDEIKRLRRELKDDLYKDADKQYNNKLIEQKTTELANGDLDKYYKALDRSILSFHKTKMDEINKIIRELWRNTYRGNDIETIEIQSDEDEGTSGAASKRRNYNYRVVMIKGDTELDMRGRCSAGQKVLASLIIRLALAETFCLNCGILALDEPTTNLDRENIEALAYALVEIIKGRARQKNFQLIIITHDEDFVELLGRSEYVEEFYKVRKNQNAHSQLVRAFVQDLHSR